jgi:hypothetical protein
MEDLQSLMACLDDISSKIPDGIYLDMADKMKRVHDHMNGNKPFHEDTFYYSDDDSELDSDDDSDSDYEMRSPVNAGEADREIRIENIRRHLLDCVRSMHQVWDEFEKWENELKRERARARPLITRMTMARKKLAIQRWCEKNASWAPGGEAGELVGCGPIVTGTNFWTWKNLVENGIRTIVLEIGTDDEKLLDFVCYDELSLETLQKLPAFEKKIYNDYKEECNRLHSIDDTVQTWKMKHEEMMQTWEMRVQEQENKLRELDADVFARDSWDAENRIFWTNDEGQMVSNGWDARTEVRR